jgi:PucR family transcriptional regulator, purine catabolism regulatory protein
MRATRRSRPRQRPHEGNGPPGGGAQLSAPQPTPLAIVSQAVAGDDGLERVACAASDALGDPVVIVLPSLGAPVVWPADSITDALLGELVRFATAAAEGAAAGEPAAVAQSVPIRIGSDVVGIVATVHSNGGVASASADDQAWLEAAAAAAAVTRLRGDGRRGEEQDSRHTLLAALIDGPGPDGAALVADARRLGFDLGAGAIAVYARALGAGEFPGPALDGDGVLIASVGEERVLGLVPLAREHSDRDAAALVEEFQDAGCEAVGISAPRREPSLLREAVREAMLLAELSCAPEATLAGQEETYRLLIGVALRDPEELELLRASTITPLASYDAEHDTELLVTLGTFLAHHGSTTETAEAMGLHRHTVGYRLSRVHEVSGLSPYESDGRERLSLGLKAAQILAAVERL